MELNHIPCEKLKGMGKKTASYLARLGIYHVQDLLFHLPFRYQDRTRVYPIRSLKPGDYGVIEGEIRTVARPVGGRTRFLCCLEDLSGHAHLRFFYMNAIQQKSLRPGVKLRCFGEIRLGPQGFEMIHPEYQVMEEGVTHQIEENLTPIYPTTAGLSQLMFRKLTTEALYLLKQGGNLQEMLPENILKSLAFPSLKEAILFVHRPPPNASVDLLFEGKHTAQKRLVFEELLAHRLTLLHLKNNFQSQRAFPLFQNHSLKEAFLKSLSFELTGAQKNVLEEIERDIEKPHPMLRLVQGDVGSGKTVVAALAMLKAIANDCQAALLAPTELLVEQHYRTFLRWFEPFDLKPAILTSQMKAQHRREMLSSIAEGRAKIIIGTHAIFQKEVKFNQLGFIVVDEQHRFGVEQRASLREKGVHQDIYPHQLIMTATPIPRTLAMSVYADLDYSVIDELPKGRKPITTTVIPNTKRDEVLTRIREACKNGRQAYWVCTLIAESEMLQCQAAEKTWQLLSTLLTDLNVALLHGRMKPDEKEKIMAQFKNGDIHVLIATTVVEVGVDVPNASLMVIENAERLGLAQLHQLRGRVGRGSIDSHCLLMYQAPLSNMAKARLAVIRETNDGFKIAERDLELRGPGEVLGTKQTGDITLKIADLSRDSELVPLVQQTAATLQKDYPDNIPKLIQRWIRDGERFGRV